MRNIMMINLWKREDKEVYKKNNNNNMNKVQRCNALKDFLFSCSISKWCIFITFDFLFKAKSILTTYLGMEIWFLSIMHIFFSLSHLHVICTLS